MSASTKAQLMAPVHICVACKKKITDTGYLISLIVDFPDYPFCQRCGKAFLRVLKGPWLRQFKVIR